MEHSSRKKYKRDWMRNFRAKNKSMTSSSAHVLQNVTLSTTSGSDDSSNLNKKKEKVAEVLFKPNRPKLQSVSSKTFFNA